MLHRTHLLDGFGADEGRSEGRVIGHGSRSNGYVHNHSQLPTHRAGRYESFDQGSVPARTAVCESVPSCPPIRRPRKRGVPSLTPPHLRGINGPA